MQSYMSAGLMGVPTDTALIAGADNGTLADGDVAALRNAIHAEFHTSIANELQVSL